MKKELAAVILTVGLLGCNATPLTTSPEIKPIPEVEPLERKLIGVKVIGNGKEFIVGLAYDTNNNNIPDTFETYESYRHDDGLMHMHKLIKTTYSKDSGDDL